jgi:ATP-dependent Clp protease ATP-binding subunit ClpC
MFERFTDRARRVVVLAQEEARGLNHSYIGTEHLLLGLLSEGEGIAARALDALGVGREAVRTEVEAAVGRGEGMPAGHIPFTPRAKKVLELSLREALHLDHSYIGTEHILLGIIAEGEGVAAVVLAKLGATPERVRPQVLELLRLTSGGEEPPGAVRALRGRIGEMTGVSGRLGQLLERLDAIERRLARIEARLGPPAAPSQEPPFPSGPPPPSEAPPPSETPPLSKPPPSSETPESPAEEPPTGT